MSLGPLYVLLGDMSVQVFCLFINWVVCLPREELWEFFIYFGDQTVVPDIIGKYVFPCSWFSYILMLFSLAMEEVFILMRSHLLILSFMSIALGDISVKILLYGISQIFLPMFSSRTFMVSWLIFKFFIHLEFIFVYGVSWCSSFFFFFWHGYFYPTFYRFFQLS